MERLIKYCMLIFGASLMIISCQEVVDVDLPPTDKRLVIDALIAVPDNESNNIIASVKLTETADYYADSVPNVNGATIDLKGGTITYRLNEQGNGYYAAAVPRQFITSQPIDLIVNYKEETYSSTANYIPAVPIDSLKQGDNGLFAGDETEVILYYTDAPDRNDYYLFNLDRGQFLTSEDTFYKGQAFSFSYFYENVKPTDTLNVQLYGITKPFYDYMSIVINQSGQNSGNPFAAPPSEVRGNIINETNAAHYPLGYFSISAVYYNDIIIE